MRVAIIEDDVIYAEEQQTYLKRFGEENKVEIEAVLFENGEKFLTSYNHNWDLILLDIEMPGRNGISIAEEIRKNNRDVCIIFVTQMAQYALAGYSVEALDYVVKPVNYNMFSMKMQRVLRILETRQTEYLFVKKGATGARIPMKNIYYIEVFNHTLLYHTTEGEIAVTGSRSISQLEEELKDKGFFRCHQCFLVNLSRVNSYDTQQVSVGESDVPVSRKRRSDFLKALMKYWGG